VSMLHGSHVSLTKFPTHAAYVQSILSTKEASRQQADIAS
jgi:hypothetical protein